MEAGWNGQKERAEVHSSERASSMSLLDALSRGPRAARPAKRAPAAMVGGGVEEDAELDVEGAQEELEDAELDVEGALDRELEALEREHHDGSDSDVSIVDSPSRARVEEVEAEPEFGAYSPWNRHANPAWGKSVNRGLQQTTSLPDLG